MTPVFIDFETQSAIDIKKLGGRVYAKHCSTRILCLCAQHEGRSFAWVPDDVCGVMPRFAEEGTEIQRGEVVPDALLQLCVRHGVAAHNASTFDRYIWDRFVRIPVKWWDTVHMARQAGLPGKLDDLGIWYTGRGKDKGQEVLHKVMKVEWDGSRWSNRFTLPGAIATVVRYCLRDVELLRVIWHNLRDYPFHDPGVEELDYTINQRGVGFDEGLAAKIASISTRVISDSIAEIHRIAPEMKDVNLRSQPQMHKWLESRGVKLRNLRKETVERFINEPMGYLRETRQVDEEHDAPSINIDPVTLRVLMLRNASQRITGAKLDKASQVCENGRLYDLLVYHAGHLGRWSSRIVQIHNLPRGEEDLRIKHLCENLTYDNVKEEAERLSISTDDVLSSLIRPCLVAKPGHVLMPVDYNAIEVRVIAWLAGEEKLLKLFRDGDDPYIQVASVLYDIPPDKVTKGQRRTAKPVMLGGIYGLGHKTLTDYVKSYGIDLTAQGLNPETVINQFRNTFPRIAGEFDGWYEGKAIRRGGLWKDLVSAFKTCVLHGVSTVAGRCKFIKYYNSVILKLPSGRPLCYRKAAIEQQEAPWGGMTDVCVYTGGRGKCWLNGGSMAENITQATARDVLAYHMQIIDPLYPIVAHVHDEPIMEVGENSAAKALQHCISIMSESPPWADGLPLLAEGHYAPRYVKGEYA